MQASIDALPTGEAFLAMSEGEKEAAFDNAAAVSEAYIALSEEEQGMVDATKLDALFAVTAAVALFFFAMASGDGRLGTWELAAALLGFLLYMHLLSPLLLPPVEKIFRGVGAFLIRLEKLIKKVQNKLKKLFPKIRECFRIKE